MYSRQSSREMRVPHNYGGSIFDRAGRLCATPVEDLTHKRPAESRQAPPTISQDSRDGAELDVKGEESEQASASPLPFSLGALGTEEILLIALALIVFQGGNDPQLALILIALLFIS